MKFLVNKNVSMKTFITAITIAVVCAVMITIIAFQFFGMIFGVSNQNDYIDKLQEIERLVEKDFIGEIDQIELKDAIADGYTKGLGDKYALYTSASEAEKRLENVSGINYGIGITFIKHPQSENLYITNVSTDSPADKGGIKKGDEITKIDEMVIANTENTEILSYISGLPLETEVSVELLRNGETVTTTLLTEKFEQQTVFCEIVDNILYIEIVKFNDYTFEQFKKVFDDNFNENIKGIVYDLRDNTGGTLNAVDKVLDYILPKGNMFYIEYKGENNTAYFDSDEQCIDCPMVVLTNGKTASAAELFTGVLKDYKYAISIGETTYGKGVAQKTYTLSDGSLVKFTIAKYYTASGSCVDKVGIKPDVEVKQTSDEITESYLSGIATDRLFKAAAEHFAKQN